MNEVYLALSYAVKESGSEKICLNLHTCVPEAIASGKNDALIEEIRAAL
jgi:hypothetical protein